MESELTQDKIARPGSLQRQMDASVTYRHIAPSDVTMADVESLDYWQNNKPELEQQRRTGEHAWNKIECIADSGEWECELRIVLIKGEGISLRKIREWHLPKKAKPGPKPKKPVQSENPEV
jgi:hypothetical protein